MYHWVLPFLAIFLIIILVYVIYRLSYSPEGFIVTMPRQEYAIPELRGVACRYIRIRPSLTDGDGYLTISQIVVESVTGDNVALKKSVTATSSGGSEIDKKYGKNVLSGQVYIFIPGESADPSVIVDGTYIARFGLSEVFETSIQNRCPINASLPDNQYVEIDLEETTNIKTISYIGRGDPMKRTIDTIDEVSDVLDQVTRLNNMRLELYDDNKNMLYSTRFTPNPSTHIANIPIETNMYTLNRGSGLGDAQFIDIPNIESYKNISETFSDSNTNHLSNNSLIRRVNNIYLPINIAASSRSTAKIFNISNIIFPTLLADSPINFYTDVYQAAGCPSTLEFCKADANSTSCDFDDITANCELDKYVNTSKVVPELIPNISVQIFGSASQAAITEMTDSIRHCKRFFLGSPGIVENYIRLDYMESGGNVTTNPKTNAYLRNNMERFCMPDIIQVFESGEFIFKNSTINRSWNSSNTTGNCTLEITPTVLSLIPYISRKFIAEWLRYRAIRYIHYKNSIKKKENPSATEQEETAELPIPAPIQIDISSYVLLDSIAQQFYEMLGGQFMMKYIYDVCSIGQTILDIRFELLMHSDSATSYLPIGALKQQYYSLLNAGATTFSQDMVDQIDTDYQINMEKIKGSSSKNTFKPVSGAVIRVFYTSTSKTNITITGLIFDDRAVTSFVTELNGGIDVPMGPEPGNVNYAPTVKYSLNKAHESFDCSDQATIKKVINDYKNTVQYNKSILLNASPPFDTSKGTLVIDKVIGAIQVSPTQCAIKWVESIYDPVTNIPIPISKITSEYVANVCGFNDVTRYGLMSYSIDNKEWFSNDLIFDASGLKFYTSNVIPECKFDIALYKASQNNRLTASTDAQVRSDFLNNTFKNGDGEICAQTLPKYKFSSTDYLAKNTDVATANLNALQHYITFGLNENRSVKGTITIPTFTTPISFKKPLPTSYTLDTASGLCPKSTCDDLDVLYDIVEQYNSNPSLPGTIMRVKRAFTAGPNQCDVEADINYDSMIENIIGKDEFDTLTGETRKVYTTIKKGTITYSIVDGKTTEGSKSMPLSGIKTVKMALYVAIDKANCSYTLADASGVDSGITIQENTPFLYKPLDYSKELSKRGSSSTGSALQQIQSDFTTTGSSVKKTLTQYRGNTYEAVGKITSLSVCPNSPKCDDASIKNQIMNYYQQTLGLTMRQILNIGSFDGKSCDVTFTNSSDQTIGMQFGMRADGSLCKANSWKNIAPTPSYSEIANVAVPISTANTHAGSSTSGFQDYKRVVNYTNPNTDTLFVEATSEEIYPLKARAFGLDSARNSIDSFTDIQFKVPLDQELPKKEMEDIVTYKFIRFVPVKTRDPRAPYVAVGKFTFFYNGEALNLIGKVTNPMGTWEGEFDDIMGPGYRNGWLDNHKKSVVFAFSSPVRIDKYSFTTSDKDVGSDPISWRIEGSSNGSFWTLLDRQQGVSTPVNRFQEIGAIPIIWKNQG